MRELKASRIREMNADEIEAKIRSIREELFNLRFRNSMRQLDNPLEIRNLRREQARLITILAEHQSGRRPLTGHAKLGEKAPETPRS
jgi:large subunit ribosomal protein L29